MHFANLVLEMHPKHSAKIIDIANLGCRIGPIHHNLKLLHVKWVSEMQTIKMNTHSTSGFRSQSITRRNYARSILVTVATFRQILASEMHPKHFAICSRHWDKFVMHTPYEWFAI
jgi:hypothetical protein